ncbi:MAG: glycosyltransferase family A protein [Candidatus Dojkabacteria bacterium]|nr:glycosyltransferase family A protein [Candidatus Dojkabacteria bacterium]
MKKPYFSVIIPVLNEENFIPKLLKSLNEQTFKNFEVIVVDNGSKDSTPKVINELEDSLKYPIKIVHCKEKGISYARNFGVEYAKGEYLIFFDADGVISGKWLEIAHKLFEKNKNIKAITGIFFHYPTSNIFKLISYNLLYHFFNFIVLMTNRILFRRYVLTGNNFAIEKKAFTKTGMFPHKIHEDIFYTKDNFLKHYSIRNMRYCLKMVLLNSPRRLEKKGIFQTYIDWIKEYFGQKPTEQYQPYRKDAK